MNKMFVLLGRSKCVGLAATAVACWTVSRSPEADTYSAPPAKTARTGALY